MNGFVRQITQINENIVHVSYTKADSAQASPHLVSAQTPKDNLTKRFSTEADKINFEDAEGQTVVYQDDVALSEVDVFKYVQPEHETGQVKSTANGDVSVIDDLRPVADHKAYSGKVTFHIDADELLTGLGQYEDGIYDYHGKKEYIYESNMRIGIPFLISSKHYGILIDTQSSVIFDSETDYMSFTIDTTNDLSYYVIVGEDTDTIMQNLRALTGKATIPPRWAFGYMQSKERYETQAELVTVAKRFRDEKIPVDCIIQDWHTWAGDRWGEKILDKQRFPDFKAGMADLHNLNTKLLFSIWPNMAGHTSDLKDFQDSDGLLDNANTYDAFSPAARALYWQQCNREIFSAGADGWWCDNSEPFSDEDWDGAIRRPEQKRYELVVDRSKKSMNWDQTNAYSLYHALGIYENWLKTNPDKRVVNLTRSTMIGAQKYGVIPWSGDQSARWSTLAHQVTEGIKMALSGMPYWTFDIGGFFTVHDKWENRGCGMAGNDTPFWYWQGDYNDGVQDNGFKELYTRWLQVGTFIPIFRSHGTDTPREPWQFGQAGEPFYDTIVKFIKLRYQLLPYIYSWAANAYFDNETIMRGFLFDFATDDIAQQTADEYMFGKAFLVAPITKPMYYHQDNQKIEDADYDTIVYLPAEAQWYDLWSNTVYEGGQHIKVTATIDKLPVFVKAGSIVPVSAEIDHADEKHGQIAELKIYAGADGDFKLYNDDGDNYSYETGNYARIPLHYDDQRATLTFGEVAGQGQFQRDFKIHVISADGDKTVQATYEGQQVSINL